MKAPTDSILALTKELISIDSTVDAIDKEQIVYKLQSWLSRSIQKRFIRILTDEVGIVVGILVSFSVREDEGYYCFNACLDTASFGDKKKWAFDPLTPIMSDDWLMGRGAADSKIAVSIFCHIAIHVQQLLLEGNLTTNICFLFDADEHTGRFGGVKQLISIHPKIHGVYIGYPGFDKILIGARGFYRASVLIDGKTPGNTFNHAAHIVELLESHSFKQGKRGHKSGQISVTNIDSKLESSILDRDGEIARVSGIKAGENDFSSIPNLCFIDVDVVNEKRDIATVRHEIEKVIQGFDVKHEPPEPPRIVDISSVELPVTSTSLLPTLIGSSNRSFTRFRINVSGISSHSGASHRSRNNAIRNAARLVVSLNESLFEITGRKNYFRNICSIRIGIDFRLTKDFNAESARIFLEHKLRDYQKRNGIVVQGLIQFVDEGESWPYYRLATNDNLVATLVESVRKVTGQIIPKSIAGPSNIGNFLSKNNIKAVCGFGVEYENIHSVNEKIRISSIEKVYQVYWETLKLLNGLCKPAART